MRRRKFIRVLSLGGFMPSYSSFTTAGRAAAQNQFGKLEFP